MSRPGLARPTRWLALERLARPFPASEEPRRSDLLVVARDLADTADRPEPSDDDGRPRFARRLSRPDLADLASAALSDALATYAADSPSTVRRVLSTWRGFCGWLRREGWPAVDPTDGLERPARPDWKPCPSSWPRWGAWWEPPS